MPSALPELWQILAVAILAIGGSLWFYRREAVLSWKIILQFFLTIALPVLTLLVIPLWILASVTDFDERVWQALVAGLVFATGWLTTAIFTEIEKLRERREKTRDFHRAIFSEIGNFLANIWDETSLDAAAQQILEQMGKDSDFVPLMPRENNDAVFNTLVSEIHILPRQTIDPVVSFYSQIKAISAMVDDMRSDEFKHLSQFRRMRMYEDYILLKKQAFQYGRYANALIDAYGKGGAKAAEARGKKISSRGVGQSGLQSE